MESFEFRILNEQDARELWDFLGDAYTTRDPTMAIANYSEEDLHALLSDSLKKGLRHGVSIGAFDKQTKEMVAVRMSWLGKLYHREEERDEIQHLPLHVKQQNEVLNIFLGKNLALTLGTIHYMRFFLLCTRQEYTRRGIATELYKRSLELARREGCKKIATVASNEYTRKITKRFGFRTEKTIRFSDYVDPCTGKKIFKDIPEPHTGFSLEVLHL